MQELAVNLHRTVDSEDDARDLIEALGEQLIALARSNPRPARPMEFVELGPLARALHAARAKRAKYLPADIFAEPSWDILLALFSAEAEGRTISISEACDASGAPATTALRHLSVLESKGLVVRAAAQANRRISYLELAPHARDQMEALLRSWHKGGVFGSEES